MLFSGTSGIQLLKRRMKLGKEPHVAREMPVGHCNAILFSVSAK